MKLPKSWGEITIPQLIEIEAIHNDKSIDGGLMPAYTRGLLKLSLITGVDYDVFEQMPIAEGSRLLKQIDFLNTYPSEKAVNGFRCGGYYWKVSCDVRNLSAAQVIDHQELTKEQDNTLKNCHKIMALYCTPYKWGRVVNMDDSDKAEILINAPVKVVYPLTVFFCKLYPSLLEITKDYLNKELVKMKKEMEELKTAP